MRSILDAASRGPTHGRPASAPLQPAPARHRPPLLTVLKWVLLGLIALPVLAVAQAVHRTDPTAAPVTVWTLRSGDPLAAQVRQAVESQGYRLEWHLDHDVPAGTSAGSYTSWQQLVIGAAQDIARMTTGPRVGAPLLCPTSRRVIVALRDEAQKLAVEAPGQDCTPLRAPRAAPSPAVPAMPVS